MRRTYRNGISLVLSAALVVLGCDDEDGEEEDRDAGIDAGALDAGEEGDAAADTGVGDAEIVEAGTDAAQDEAGVDAATDAATDPGDAGDAGDAAIARTVQMAAGEFYFDPDSIQAEPGEMLTIMLTNEGAATHDLLIDFDPDDVALPGTLASGASESITFSVPSETGSYDFWCPIGDHRTLGMEGQIIVGD